MGTEMKRALLFGSVPVSYTHLDVYKRQQLLYLNRVPDHAAVSEAVSLARKKAKNPRAAGLVNGVLRSLIRQREAMEPPADLSTRYSHPQWLVDSFVARLGREEAEALLAADNGEPPTCRCV